MSTTLQAERFLKNNSAYLERLRTTVIGKVLFALTPRLRMLYVDYTEETGIVQKARDCAKVLNAIDENTVWRQGLRLLIAKENIRVIHQQNGYRHKTIDNTPRDTKDYYLVAVIVKNEARYIREFILFYRATGADRIYIYDNDSSDNLIEEINPFLESGFVVYRYLHGPVVQTFAYRDAVRRTKHRTKWLAFVDADEFLFSPKGNMPEQLKAYEHYPGIGVNWVVFGPGGHMERPSGLVIDNYTETFADMNKEINLHIKSIVQPMEVFCVRHTHYALYNGRKYAVNEKADVIDNYCAVVGGAGKAFTECNNRDTFRINHYFTRSLEDLKEKCSRGSADGADKITFDAIKKSFEVPMTEDYSIKPYADIVREEYNTAYTI